MEKGTGKENSSRIIFEEKRIVSEANAIAGIILIVEIDLVDIEVELAIVIAERVEAVQFVKTVIWFTASLSANKCQKLCCILFGT